MSVSLMLVELREPLSPLTGEGTEALRNHLREETKLAFWPCSPLSQRRVLQDKARGPVASSVPLCSLLCGFKFHCLLTDLSPAVSAESITIINSSNG